MLWVTLLLAILAAGAVAEFVARAEHLAAHRMPPWPGPWLRLATFVPLLLVLVESWSATAHPVVPAQPPAMRTVTGPMLVLPTAALTTRPSCSGRRPVPADRQRRRRLRPHASRAAPHGRRRSRTRRAPVPPHAGRQHGTAAASAGGRHPLGTRRRRPVDTLGIRREDLDDAVVFRLN